VGVGDIVGKLVGVLVSVGRGVAVGTSVSVGGIDVWVLVGGIDVSEGGTGVDAGVPQPANIKPTNVNPTTCWNTCWRFIVVSLDNGCFDEFPVSVQREGDRLLTELFSYPNYSDPSNSIDIYQKKATSTERE
jgi:hypothetical protein